MGLVKKAILRGGLPFIIMTGISISMKYKGMDPYQVKSTFLTGLIITAVAAASVLYEIEGWSLKKQSIVHFLLMLVTVFPCLMVSGWFPLNTPLDFIKLIGIFLLVGLVLWSLFYVLFSKVIKS
ncbi:MAG: DUF3021 domain-containing protein [Hornefia sp.]|nr:DUF3021 domain-containing protein [Hornefia sp.]